MTQLLVLQLDRDTAAHLAVALRRHRGELTRRGMAEPPALADLESVARGVVKHQEQSHSGSVLMPSDDGLHEREYLSRSDVSRTTGASLATVDRWISGGNLPSSKHGRTRRVARADLQRFLAA